MYAVEFLSIFIDNRTFHLECHFNTIVTCFMHDADNAYSIRSTWSCCWLFRFFTVAHNGKLYSLVFSLISLFIFSLWMCPFDSIVSLDVELDNGGFDR